MTKYALAFLLLHLCYTVRSDSMSLNAEIIERLKILNDLCKPINQTNITLPRMMRVPSPNMKSNALSCVATFIKELKHILNNVTVHEDKLHILQELEVNLKLLRPVTESVQDCKMITAVKPRRPFAPYIEFLRKLNIQTKI